LNDSDVYIIDAFNPKIFPRDRDAKKAIRREILLNYDISDDLYLQKIQEQLDLSIADFIPDLIFYNAGTDCLDGDPLGDLSITDQGIIARDELLFRFAFKHSIPIVMVLSGGYQMTNASIIARSIINLESKLSISRRI
jgi:histone deacetylase 11